MSTNYIAVKGQIVGNGKSINGESKAHDMQDLRGNNFQTTHLYILLFLFYAYTLYIWQRLTNPVTVHLVNMVTIPPRVTQVDPRMTHDWPKGVP